MKNIPLSVILTTIFVILNALIWLALGIIIAVNALPSLPVPPEIKMMMALLSIAMAGILLGLFILLHRGNRVAYYLTVAFFIFVSVLTIFDDVGLADIFVLVLNLVPIGLLIKDRKRYLTAQP